MKKGIVAAGIAVAALAAVIVVPKLLKPKAVQEEALVPVVEVQKPQLGTIELYRNLVGSVEPSDVVYVYPKAAGEVTGGIHGGNRLGGNAITEIFVSGRTAAKAVTADN